MGLIQTYYNLMTDTTKVKNNVYNGYIREHRISIFYLFIIFILASILILKELVNNMDGSLSNVS